MNDCHCHFFSEQFFATLGGQRPPGAQQSAAEVVSALGWDPPGSAQDLADRWVRELDRQDVGRAALIASVPGDEGSVGVAIARHPSRFVGFFMVDPTAPDAASRVEHAFHSLRLRGVCLFPAMQRYSLHDARVAEIVQIASRHASSAVFVHCGALSVGVRKKLGLPSRFDVSFGNPLDVHALAVDHPSVPFIIPHFGAGLLREALMVADLCPNVFLDTSSTNRWMAYTPSLTLTDVFRQALAVAGPDRLLFGTDSSFFPRGWTRQVHDAQVSALDSQGVDETVRRRIFGENFDRLFPLRT
ncbi:MAG TPA: amidohydrolase family protein [Vicinamibacterales bacterium]|nr:amidohydrolase family protein [Vicinamibacterales bacterium]